TVIGTPYHTNIYIRNMDQDTSGNDSLYLIPVTFSPLVVDSNDIINDGTINMRPDWNSTVNQIAFISDRDSVFNIFVTNISPGIQADTIPVKLTDVADKISFFTQPAFSPNGSQIVYNSTASGKEEIWIMNANGTNKTQLTNTNAPITGRPRFSPSGDKVVFYSTMWYANGTDSLQIYTMNPDGSGLDTVTTSGNNYDPAWSPDGQKIIFAKRLSASRGRIYIMNRDGTNQQEFIGNNQAYHPIWRMK
ncbi:hypothetical protein L0152_20215, partial [bacterium]|nr:hypothetical protein [bacterium]